MIFSFSNVFALNVQFVMKLVMIWLSNARSAVNSASPTSASTSLPCSPNLICDSLHSTSPLASFSLLKALCSILTPVIVL